MAPSMSVATTAPQQLSGAHVSAAPLARPECRGAFPFSTLTTQGESPWLRRTEVPAAAPGGRPFTNWRTYFRRLLVLRCAFFIHLFLNKDLFLSFFLSKCFF